MRIDSQALEADAHAASCEALLDAAEPSLYRQNAFRVLGVDTSSSIRSISRQSRRRTILDRYGDGDAGDAQQTCLGILPLQPQPDDGEVNAARQRLRDPQSRIVDELFWFWARNADNGSSDQAIQALQRGDRNTAVKLWSQWRKQDDSDGVATHNLAVLYHILALDWEQQATEKKLTSEGTKHLKTCWKRSLQHWRSLLDNEPFWQRYSNRIRKLNDPRVHPDAAMQMREALPEALLLINAKLALQCARNGERKRARYHVAITQTIGWDKAADRALEQAAGPLRRRISALCEEWEATADSDPANADEAAEGLISSAKPLLNTIECMLPDSHPVMEMLHDKVATTAMQAQVRHGRESDDWERSEELLEAALPLARGSVARQRLEQNLEIVRNNKKHQDLTGKCWFCGGEPDDSAKHEIKMYGDVVRVPTWQGVEVQYRHGAFPVPRCKECQKAHSGGADAGSLGCLGAVVGGIGGAVLAGPLGVGSSAAIWVGLIGVGIIGTIIGAIVYRPKKDGKTRKGLGYAHEHPLIKELRADDWEFGEKPTA